MAITSHAKALFNFLKDIYGPHVAILATKEVRGMFWKNGLTIKEFFEPFSNLNIEWTVRDPSGIGGGSGSAQNIHSSAILGTYKLRTIHLNISEVSGPDNPPQNSELFDRLLKEELNDIAVRLVPNDDDKSITRTDPQAYPWYNAYRKSWLQNILVMEHEYIRYYISVLLMVSSHQSDPMAIFEQLELKLASIIHKQQDTKPENRSTQPKFLAEHLIKSYVLVHDMGSHNLEEAETVYHTMQKKFSPKYCHFLKINSNTFTKLSKDSAAIPSEQNTTQCNDIWLNNLRNNRDIARRMDRSSKQSDADPQAPKVLTGSFLEESTEQIQEPQSHIPPPPIPHEVGQYMSLNDNELVKQFLLDYVSWSLLPHLETLMRVLYERVSSHNKISRLFSTFKKYTSNKGTTTPHLGLDQYNEIYTSESVELQTRMLGDISFLLQNWELAYNMYHSVKKDFQSDQAWWLYASAVEMTALSVFMLPTIKKDPATYFDECFQQYFSICKSTKYALHALMLWGEVLKARILYMDAVNVYTKLLGKVDDLCNAMLLEQAALCVMARRPIRTRKAAQLMVLSSHMYTKSNHPRHSVRLLKQALLSLQGKSWIAAEDYLLHILGQHSSFLGKKEFAYNLFESLLSHDPKIYFQFVSSTKQEEILKEFLSVFQENRRISQNQPLLITTEECSYESTKHLIPLPLPKVDCTLIRTSWCAGSPEYAFKQRFDAIKGISSCYFNADEEMAILKESRDKSELISRASEVLLKRPLKKNSVFKNSNVQESTHQNFNPHKSIINVGTAQFAYSGSLQTSEWKELELSAAKMATGKILNTMSFRSLSPFLNPKTDNLQRGFCVSEECICIEIFLRNPLNVSLNLSDIALQWVLENDNTKGKTVLSEIIPTYKLPACGQRLLQLQLQPLAEEGVLHVTGLLYTVEPSKKISYVIELEDNQTEHDEEIFQAQGVLELSVRGIRLNETKEHKTNALYAPDFRLQWEIVPAMPRLLLRFQHWPTHLLAGQIYTIPVELYNCGSLPLHNLIVSSPDYASFIFNFDSGTSMADNIFKKQNGLEAIQLESNTNLSRKINIQPLPSAHGIKGTFVLKTQKTPGEHEMNFLFYYDTIFPEGEKKHSLNHRVHTHTAYVQVVSSIDAKSDISRSDMNEENTNIAYGSISIENIDKDGSPESYQISSIISISKTWEVKAIPNTFDESTLNLPPGILTQLHFMANKRNEDSSEEIQNDYIVTTVLEIEKTPGVDYNFDLLSIQDEFTTLSKSQGFTILFLIKWRTLDNENTHYGTHYLKPTYTDQWNDQSFNPMNISNNPKEKYSPHQLINCILVHPESIIHDFTQQPLCMQQITVNFQNLSGQDVFIKVQFDLPTQGEKQEYKWVGAIVKKFKLKPFQFLAKEQTIIFSHEGVFNLMNFTITASNQLKGKFLPQYGASVSYLIVERPE